MAKYEALKERALVNFELLLDFWKISYVKINSDEYDFINPTREDQNYGACRFNIKKGTGADFAGANYTDIDYKRLGPGFSREDFAGYSKGTASNWGFDIIGLCQRLNGIDNYKDAAGVLRANLTELSRSTKLRAADPKASEIREHERNTQRLKTLNTAIKTWNLCEDYRNTVGENYLKSRGLYIQHETSIKFHAKIYNKELNFSIPALLFKVAISPDDPLIAIHRIYIAKDGSRKANISNPKMALGGIQGAGIWFGEKGDTLGVVEGPENALSVRILGSKFVVCTISATNFANLCIPNYVKNIILFPDPDTAGRANAIKAVKSYTAQNKNVKTVFPPERTMPNGKLADWNDIVKEASCG